MLRQLRREASGRPRPLFEVLRRRRRGAMRIQLITFTGCPNAAAAREVLTRVLAAAGIADVIEEVDTSDTRTPEALRSWGSPTVLIDGVDIGSQDATSGPGCRLYANDEGASQTVPPESLILAALRSRPPRAPAE